MSYRNIQEKEISGSKSGLGMYADGSMSHFLKRFPTICIYGRANVLRKEPFYLWHSALDTHFGDTNKQTNKQKDGENYVENVFLKMIISSKYDSEYKTAEVKSIIDVVGCEASLQRI